MQSIRELTESMQIKNIMVHFRINWTLQIGLSRFSGSQCRSEHSDKSEPVGIGNSAYQTRGAKVVHGFLT